MDDCHIEGLKTQVKKNDNHTEKSIDQLRERFIQMGPFPIDPICNRDLFTQEEIATLKKYGYWFEAMAYGKVPLVTEKQKHFVKAQKKGYEPKNRIESLWFRYTDATKAPF